ncbi:MAG: hypothetical protein IJD51_00615 [Clostridia bacterium]|nr:hypothetical protein [Clostridia bacterium]
MEYYKKEFEVDIHDVDFNGVARTSALMRLIQSTAQSQLTEGGMSYDSLKDKKRAFVLSRIRMEFTEDIHAYERLVGISFPCHSRGYSFLRCYELLRDGGIVGRAASVWALIDTDTHALVKVNDFELGLTTFDPLDYPISRIVMPESMTLVGKYEVTYDSVDQNRHMNNTKYPDMYSNFLDLEGRRIEEITINYRNEAPAGDVLTVLRGESEGRYYFRTFRSDGRINSEAEIRTVPLDC